MTEIYLDSAATSLHKPPQVAQAVAEAICKAGNAARGAHGASLSALRTVYDTRCLAARLLGCPRPDHVVFAANSTMALNIAICGLLSPGDHAISTDLEHNSVLRPLYALQRQGMALSFVPADKNGQVSYDAFERLFRPNTRAVVCTHASNVTGDVLDIPRIAAMAHRRGALLILDASQTAGAIPLDMTALGAAFIAMPGHKGLYGPQGTGVLLCGKDVPVRTLLEGGTGSISIQQEMPDFLPDRLEAGTHNMPGIAGLLAGVRFVRQLGPEAICAGERQLTFQAAEGLRRLPGLQVFALPDLAAQAGVLSIVPEHMDAEALGAALADRGIAVRAGLHCAPLAHRTAGTLDTGTVRLSFSHWNTREEVSRFLVAMGEILR